MEEDPERVGRRHRSGPSTRSTPLGTLAPLFLAKWLLRRLPDLGDMLRWAANSEPPPGRRTGRNQVGYIVVDTCVWLELASKPNLRPLLDALGEFLVPPPHQLVVPAPVLTEFNRNRSNCQEAWERSFKGHIQNFKIVYQAIPGTKDDLVRARDLAQQTIEKNKSLIACASRPS